MMSKLWSGRGVAIATAVVTCAALVVLVSWSVVSPAAVSSGALGPEWQCSRVAFVLTTCIRAAEARRQVIPVRAKQDDCPPGI
ncbi:hypothetical protein J6500_07160 [Bradyrhizobium sp. WSM 1704]|uniref:hypothetical protein n=1 Tax=Bradyrhizobium semiaridum TaxID=2821404 RepID=UPI001CE3B0EE|nr:hypothetical protein [Bradyrhizobium semiaridum]MCA6121680.1 hypothetical protein [Bradyrhizobium semiaridum]